MHNFRKIRLIQKGQAGFQFTQSGLTPTTSGSILNQSILDQISQYQAKVYQTQQAELEQQRQQQIQNNYKTASNILNFTSQGLTNYGITTGNSTVAGIGQLGNITNNGLQLAQNWNNLSVQDRLTGTSGLTGQAMDTLDNMFFSKQHTNDSALTRGMNNMYDSVSSSLMAFSPVGTIIGGAMKAGKFLGDGLTALGVGTDQMTTKDQILDSNFMKLTPVGLINSIGAKRTQSFSANKDTLERVGSSYGGSKNLINEAVSKANKKYGVFSSDEGEAANNLIGKARGQQDTMTRISDEYQDQLANKSQLAYSRYFMNINGGFQPIRAKQGAILERISLRKHKEGGEIKKEIQPWQPKINTIIEFKEGGEIKGTADIEWQPEIKILAEGGKVEEPTNQKNVIPEGALHAHKHNMDHAEDLTKKGIPVIDNKGEQQAEVERNEIIFNLEVTKQLEELHNKYLKEETTQKEKDELAIEAGKLLVYEILHNTEDRTGLIKECKKGGVLDELK